MRTHDHLAVHEDGRSREAVIRLLGAELFDEMFGPDELAIQPVDGDEVAPRIQTEREVTHDERCRDRSVIGTVDARVALTELEAPSLGAGLGIESGQDIDIARLEHRRDQSARNRDARIAAADRRLPTDFEAHFPRPGKNGRGVSNPVDVLAAELRPFFVIALLAGGVLMSYEVKMRFASVFEAFQTFLSFFQGALFALLLFGMLTRRATPAAGVAGMIVGVAAAAGLNGAGVLFLWTAWWSFVAASVAILVVSTFTEKKPEEELRGLVCWMQ